MQVIVLFHQNIFTVFFSNKFISCSYSLCNIGHIGASLVVQWYGIHLLVWGWKAFLEKEVATHSSILAREIPWTESMVLEVTRVQHDLVTKPPPLPHVSERYTEPKDRIKIY